MRETGRATYQTMGPRHFFLSLWVLGASIAVSAAVSLGDRLVLENSYLNFYWSLPLTVDAARKQGWLLDGACVEGVGIKATGGVFSNNTLALYFDNAGFVYGYGASVATQMASPPWVTDDIGSSIRLTFRAPELACSAPAPQLHADGWVVFHKLCIREAYIRGTHTHVLVLLFSFQIREHRRPLGYSGF
jgi:hypothetical protein